MHHFAFVAAITIGGAFVKGLVEELLRPDEPVGEHAADSRDDGRRQALEGPRLRLTHYRTDDRSRV